MYPSFERDITQETTKSKFPGLVNGFDGPFELLAEGLGEELLDGDVELLTEDDGKTGVDIVLDIDKYEGRINWQRGKWEKTHNLRSTQGNLLVVLFVLSLELHRLNTLLELLDGGLELLNGGSLAFGFHLASLVLLVEPLLHVLNDLKTRIQLACLHFFLSISNELLVVLLELLLDLLPLFFKQESLVFLDPFHVHILVHLEELGAFLLLQRGLKVEHLLLEAPTLIAKTLDLICPKHISCNSDEVSAEFAYAFAHLLHLVGMGRSDSPLVVTENSDLAVGIVVGLHLLRNVTRRFHLLEQRRHGVGGVVGTEHFRSQALHVSRQVLVECRGLMKSDRDDRVS